METMMIPHSKPSITEDDIRAVAAIVESGMLAPGDKVCGLETALGKAVGRAHVAAVSSGTAALYCALAALGVTEGDEVIIPAYVCSSLLYAVRMTGAKAVIADSGHDIFHMDTDTVKACLSSRTKAIVFPHMFGTANDLSGIVALGVPVIEDCALSLGSSLNGKKSGALGTFAAVCSFFATKVIASGEGGAVLSDDAAFIDMVRDMSDYADKIDDRMRFNFGLSDLHAALAFSQLERLDSMIVRRRELARCYTQALAGTSLALPMEKNGETHIFYRYVVRHENISEVRAEMRDRGVAVERPVFTTLNSYPGMGNDCPRAEEAWRTALSIPLYPALTDSEANTVTQELLECLQ